MNVIYYEATGTFHHSLVRELGLVEGILVSAIYESTKNRRSPYTSVDRDGRTWRKISKSMMADMLGEQVSVRTITRKVNDLVASGILLEKDNGRSEPKSYAVNCELVNETIREDLIYAQEWAVEAGNKEWAEKLGGKLSAAEEMKMRLTGCQPVRQNVRHMSNNPLSNKSNKYMYDNLSDPPDTVSPPDTEDSQHYLDLLLFGSSIAGVMAMHDGLKNLFEAILEVCAIPARRIQSPDAEVIIRMHFEDGLSGENVREWYSPGGWWYFEDWRGKKGQRPTLKQIDETFLSVQSESSLAQAAWDDVVQFKQIPWDWSREYYQRMRHALAAVGGLRTLALERREYLAVHKPNFVAAFDAWTKKDWFAPAEVKEVAEPLRKAEDGAF
jgi:hypothetical protein